MTALDESGQGAAPSVGLGGAGLEKAGTWLMAAYWLAMLAILAVGGMASGG